MRLVWIFVWCCVTATTGWAAPKDDLRGVKEAIKNKKTIITKVKKVEKVVSSQLQEIDRTLQQKQADLGKLDLELRGVEKGLDKTSADINRVAGEVAIRKHELEKRLVSLYKAGDISMLRIIFSSGSFQQMTENMQYMRSILQNDKATVEEYKTKLDELNSLKSHLERDMIKKGRLKEKIVVTKHDIEAEKAKKTVYLNQVRQDRKSHEASLRELQANASRLQAMISRLDALSRKKSATRSTEPPPKKGGGVKPQPELPPAPDRGFFSQKGRLSLPVRGSVISSYGKHKHPEFDSYTFNKGISIAAPAGTEFRSIYEGNVIFAEYFKGFGNMIIVDHGGGYFSLYAHASRLAKRVGAAVAKGDSLGSVGDIDSAKGPMLYFEIRQQGKPVDPAAWVR